MTILQRILQSYGAINGRGLASIPRPVRATTHLRPHATTVVRPTQRRWLQSHQTTVEDFKRWCKELGMLDNPVPYKEIRAAWKSHTLKHGLHPDHGGSMAGYEKVSRHFCLPFRYI